MRRIFRLALLAPLTLGAGCYLAEDVEPLRVTADGEVFAEYLLGLTDAASESAVLALAERHGLDLVEVRNSDRLAVLVDPGERDRDDVLDALAAEPEAEWAEPQFVYAPSRTVNDYGEYMWGLSNTGLNGGTLGADIDAFGAWDRATGRGVVVAIIDTGVDTSHPDLVPNLWRNAGEVAGNGVDDDGNGYIDDVNGFDFVNRDGVPDDLDEHGTHVAGSVAARGDDGYGVPGVAFGAQIMSLKFMERNRGGTSSSAAEAITYAVNHGAHIINASWGGPGQSSAIRNAISYARSRGVLFVTAAGNEGRNNETTATYPANYPLDNIVAVAASDRRDRLASFSNYGRTRVHLAAPGVDIVSTTPGEEWSYMDGTSMASPYVAGAAALVRELAPGLNPAAVRALLMSSVDPLSSGGDRIASGGRLNAFAALDLAAPAPVGGAAPPPPPAPAEWSFVAFPIESPHPYANDFSGQVQVVAPTGATQLRLHFSRIDVESNYDFVVVKDEAGNKLAEWTGNRGAVVSETLEAASVRLHLFSDSSVTGWGLALTGFDWR